MWGTLCGWFCGVGVGGAVFWWKGGSVMVVGWGGGGGGVGQGRRGGGVGVEGVACGVVGVVGWYRWGLDFNDGGRGVGGLGFGWGGWGGSWGGEGVWVVEGGWGEWEAMGRVGMGRGQDRSVGLVGCGEEGVGGGMSGGGMIGGKGSVGCVVCCWVVGGVGVGCTVVGVWLGWDGEVGCCGLLMGVGRGVGGGDGDSVGGLWDFGVVVVGCCVGVGGGWGGGGIVVICALIFVGVGCWVVGSFGVGAVAVSGFRTKDGGLIVVIYSIEIMYSDCNYEKLLVSSSLMNDCEVQLSADSASDEVRGDLRSLSGKVSQVVAKGERRLRVVSACT
ncbi:hypothetical protein Tco_1293656 [Tanacetum coccineum]